MTTIITTSNNTITSGGFLTYRLLYPIRAQNINIASATIFNQYYNINQYYNTLQFQFNGGQYTITIPSAQYSASTLCSTVQSLLATIVPSFTIILTGDFYSVFTSQAGSNFWFKLFGDSRDRVLLQYFGFDKTSSMFKNVGSYSYVSNYIVNLQVTSAINVSLGQPNMVNDTLSIFMSIPVNAGFLNPIFYQQQNDANFDLCPLDQQIQVNNLQFQLLDDYFNPLVLANSQFNISWVLK